MRGNIGQSARIDMRLTLAGLFAAVLLWLSPHAALAEAVVLDGNYYWYVPEHEKTGRTAFYSAPSFSSPQVRVSRAQRFKMIATRKGWSLIELDYAGKAYIHLRILRVSMYDPAASDLWYEFKRASFFPEDPVKLEAQMRGQTAPTTTQTTDSKLPAWKRYKEGWNVKSTRSPHVPAEGMEPTGASVEPTRPPAEKKARNNRYPLLPPIGSEPAKDGATPESPSNPDSPARP